LTAPAGDFSKLAFFEVPLYLPKKIKPKFFQRRKYLPENLKQSTPKNTIPGFNLWNKSAPPDYNGSENSSRSGRRQS
jgi:hypothetical protein